MSQAVLRVVEREDSDKKRALEAALSQIDRAFGKGSVMKLGQRERAVDADAVSTGSLGLDIALGIGGLPRGRVVEVYGPESSGKTTLALHVVAEIQKKGGVAAYVDAEHALDPKKKTGRGSDELLISQPDTGSGAENRRTLKPGGADVRGTGRHPASGTRRRNGRSVPGLQARLMSQALRKSYRLDFKSNTIVIFINQIWMKIGAAFGNPETTTGGNTPYASVRFDIRRIGATAIATGGRKSDARQGGQNNRALFRQVEFDIMYGHGISSELIDLGACRHCREIGSGFPMTGSLGQGRGASNISKPTGCRPQPGGHTLDAGLFRRGLRWGRRSGSADETVPSARNAFEPSAEPALPSRAPLGLWGHGACGRFADEKGAAIRVP
jgi:recombination protein RecA